MKYGLLMHINTQNIGDDIQAYASSLFLPSVDYMVDREKIDIFKSDDEEPVAVVMNGWYMWAKWRWPPSNYIVPKFVGFHYTDPALEVRSGSPIRHEFLEGIGGDYLNAYGPIGCRDTFTQNLFKQIGVDSYFSGCVTLTLPKMRQNEESGKYVCLVDVGNRVERRVRKLLKGSDIGVITRTSRRDYRGSKDSWEQRKARVEELLADYQNAKCVITSRLHCALPCLAMDVPVLMVKDKLDAIRFDPYYDWVYKTTPAAFLEGEYNDFVLSPPPNKQKHVETREKLIQAIIDFVKETENMSETVEELSKASYSNADLQEWQNETMKRTMDLWLEQGRTTHLTIRTLQKENMQLKQNPKMVNSRLYKTAKAARSFLKIK